MCEPKQTKPKRKRMSNAQFNNRYVRSDKGHKAEVRGSSDDALAGTNAEQRVKVEQ